MTANTRTIEAWVIRRVLAALIALVITSAPVGTRAQQPRAPIRIGVLCLIPCQGSAVSEFRRALQELGYVEGRVVVFEYRDADWKVERLQGLANDLVQSKVDIIFTPWGTAAALAAKRATTTIPVVIGAAGDPVGAGIVTSLSKPGGNVTGLSSLALELEGKRVEFAKEVFPRLSRVGTFWHPENPYSALAFKQVDAATRALGGQVRAVRLGAASDLGAAFATLKRERVDVLVVSGYDATLQHRRAIIDFASANRLAAVYPLREYVDEGGLLSYGANVADISQRAAHYVDRIVKGARPADLPVEQATTVELVVNVKTARALGITLAPALLLRADQVVQ